MTSHHDVAVRLRDLAPDGFDAMPITRKAMLEAADLLETQTKALSEANDHIQQLQRALSFWMPGVTEASDIETNGRVADDAYLLMGYNGPISDDCWGDRTHKRALAAEARLAEAIKHIESADLWTDENYDVGDWREAARAFTNAAKEKT